MSNKQIPWQELSRSMLSCDRNHYIEITHLKNLVDEMFAL